MVEFGVHAKDMTYESSILIIDTFVMKNYYTIYEIVLNRVIKEKMTQKTYMYKLINWALQSDESLNISLSYSHFVSHSHVSLFTLCYDYKFWNPPHTYAYRAYVVILRA